MRAITATKARCQNDQPNGHRANEDGNHRQDEEDVADLKEQIDHGQSIVDQIQRLVCTWREKERDEILPPSEDRFPIISERLCPSSRSLAFDGATLDTLLPDR